MSDLTTALEIIMLVACKSSKEFLEVGKRRFGPYKDVLVSLAGVRVSTTIGPGIAVFPNEPVAPELGVPADDVAPLLDKPPLGIR